MIYTKISFTDKLTVLVLGAVFGLGFLSVGGGCSASSHYIPTGNPLLDLRNPELLERDRVSAARQAWDEVEKGVRVRERTRKALKNLAWSNATTPALRYTVLELLMSDQSAEGSVDSRAMARLILPTERSPTAVRIIADQAVAGGWDELVPALVRSYARTNSEVLDTDRIERAALLALRPGMNIERIVFDVFLHPSQGLSDAREQAVLRLAQRTRDDAWGLLARLDESGDLRKALVSEDFEVGAEADSRMMIADLRSALNDLAVLPDTAMEIQWLSNLKRHPDQRNLKLNAQWWAQTSGVVSSLHDGQLDGLAMRHLEPIRWASEHRTGWLSMEREELLSLVGERLGDRVHHKRKNQKGEKRRKELVWDWADELSFGDLLTILVVDDVVRMPVVAEQIFRQRVLDKKDESTEYGGVIELNSEEGVRAVLYRPRARDRVNDQRFVASDDMFRYSDRSLVHYHMHADKRDNGKYAGPSHADLINVSVSGRTNLVFTSLGKRSLNIDLYFPNGAVIDLGEIVEEK